MNILGISAFYHDSAACLVRDGRIVAAAQEERFTRKRHDADFPKEAVRYCLEAGGISARDLDLVAFYEKPFLKFERLLETYLAFAPRGLRSFLKAMPVWMKEKLWIRELISRELGYGGRIVFPEHHQAHAASAFFASPFESAAVLTMDGVGEWATASYGVGTGRELKLLKEIRFPHSLGLLYSAFTYYTGFKVNSGEYKVMGLAPYGKPIFKDLILRHLIELKDDGSFRLDMSYFNFCAGLTMTNDKFHRLFGGAPRRPETKVGQREMDLARSIQEVTEEVMLKMARHVRQATGQKHLCLAGGVSLNCVGNGKILRERIFDGVWVQPAAGDAGGALGAALWAWHGVLEKPRTAGGAQDAMQASLLGPSYSDAEIEAYLRCENIPYTELSESEIAERTAARIAEGRVIGWFQGRMEFGPRALGARSILADPRVPNMKDILNAKIKFREGFRPFAPSVIEERTGDYFDLPAKSPYMLFTAPTRAGLRLPSITHVDGSARIQTVDAASNARYHALIKRFGELTGTAVVINTSFNVRGEPLVCRPEEAYRCFMRTDIDHLVMGRFMLDKERQRPLAGDEDWQKRFELD